MELKLQRTVLKLDIYGNLFEIAKPTYAFAKEWQAKVKDMSEEEVASYTVELLQSFGIPKDIIESLEIEHLGMIIEAIFGAKKK